MKSMKSLLSGLVLALALSASADAQEKVQETLTRIINDGDGGMICILL